MYFGTPFSKRRPYRLVQIPVFMIRMRSTVPGASSVRLWRAACPIRTRFYVWKAGGTVLSFGIGDFSLHSVILQIQGGN